MESGAIHRPVGSGFYRKTEGLSRRNDDELLDVELAVEGFAALRGKNDCLMVTSQPFHAEVTGLELHHLREAPVMDALDLVDDSLPDPLVVAVAPHGPPEHDASVVLGHLAEDRLEQIVERTKLGVTNLHTGVAPHLTIVARLPADEHDDHLAGEFDFRFRSEDTGCEQVAGDEELRRLLGGLRLGTDPSFDTIEEKGVGQIRRAIAEFLDTLETVRLPRRLDERLGDDHVIQVIEGARPGDAQLAEVSAGQDVIADHPSHSLAQVREETLVVHHLDLLDLGDVVQVVLERGDALPVRPFGTPGDLVERNEHLHSGHFLAAQQVAELLDQSARVDRVLAEPVLHVTSHVGTVAPVGRYYALLDEGLGRGALNERSITVVVAAVIPAQPFVIFVAHSSFLRLPGFSG